MAIIQLDMLSRQPRTIQRTLQLPMIATTRMRPKQRVQRKEGKVQGWAPESPGIAEKLQELFHSITDWALLSARARLELKPSRQPLSHSEVPSTHLTSPHLTSPHLTSSHLISSHLTSSYLTLPYLTLPYLTLPYLTLAGPWSIPW